MTTDTARSPEVGLRILAGGIETNYHDQGHGDPVLLIHGFGPGASAWANWYLTIPALAGHMRVLAPDLAGFGRTRPPGDGEYGLERWLQHLTGFVDALALERVSVVANSFGGGLALHLAARFPERIDKLVLTGSAGLTFPITQPLDDAWGFTPSVAQMQRLLDAFTSDRDAAAADLAHTRLAAATRPGVQEAYASMFPAPRQRWVDAIALSEQELRKLPHDVLILHGREDRVVPPSVAIRISELIPRAQLHLFGPCGHWTQIERSDVAHRLILDHLTAHPERAD